MEAPGSAYVANTVKEIMSERLSWNVTIFDGKGEPARYATGIQQALVAHADGIILVAVDCETAQPALESAKSANVPVVSLAGFDCPNDESLITAADFGGSAKAQYGSEGVALAEYVAAQTEGQAKAIVATEPDLQSTVTEFEEFKSTLTKLCPECEITAEAPALIADIANGSAAQKLSQVMLQNPDANVLVALQDAELEYISNALRTASQQLPVLAAGPLPTDPQMIENGSLQGVMAYDANMSMWVIVDNMVRLLAGTQAVVVPSVFTLMDKEHNLPASGGFVAPVDYEKAYLKSWGVK
jgi:ribose transport system substrate-binding protein